MPRPYMVLIETLWNVKVRCIRTQEQTADGINRNIVECKERTHTQKANGTKTY